MFARLFRKTVVLALLGGSLVGAIQCVIHEPHLMRPRLPLEGVTIIVDPGHGGRDPGARGVGPVPEKVVNLAVGRRLANLLHARGANVLMTRSDDRFIELDDRAALADRRRADLFVSIHSDASGKSSTTGSTLYIARNARSESRQAAESLHGAIQRARVKCLGIREAGFRVLVGHSRPAVLIECGFLTNDREARALCSSSYQARLAAIFADGISAYFYDRSRGRPLRVGT